MRINHVECEQQPVVSIAQFSGISSPCLITVDNNTGGSGGGSNFEWIKEAAFQEATKCSNKPRLLSSLLVGQYVMHNALCNIHYNERPRPNSTGASADLKFLNLTKSITITIATATGTTITVARARAIAFNVCIFHSKLLLHLGMLMLFFTLNYHLNISQIAPSWLVLSGQLLVMLWDCKQMLRTAVCQLGRKLHAARATGDMRTSSTERVHFWFRFFGWLI